MLYLLAGCRQPVHHRRCNSALESPSRIRTGFHQSTSGCTATDYTAVPNTDTSRNIDSRTVFGLEKFSGCKNLPCVSSNPFVPHDPLRLWLPAIHTVVTWDIGTEFPVVCLVRLDVNWDN